MNKKEQTAVSNLLSGFFISTRHSEVEKSKASFFYAFLHKGFICYFNSHLLIEMLKNNFKTVLCISYLNKPLAYYVVSIQNV